MKTYSERIGEYQTIIKEYINKKYPLINEIYGNEGVQQIVNQEIDTTRDLYDTLSNRIAHTIIGHEGQIQELLQDYKLDDKELALSIYVTKIISTMPNREEHIRQHALSIPNKALSLLANKGLLNVYQVFKILTRRNTQRKCPFPHEITKLVTEGLKQTK